MPEIMKTWAESPGLGDVQDSFTFGNEFLGESGSAESANGSSRSTRPSKASSTSKTTAAGLPRGVLTRIAQRLLSLAAGIWHNWTTGTTRKRSLIAHDH
jgi:hypothetical protein